MQSFQRRQDLLPPLLLLGALVLAMAVLVVGFLAHEDSRRTTQAQVEAQLETIASLKVEQVTAWRGERLGDAQRVMNASAITDALVAWSANPNSVNTSVLERRLDALLIDGRYDSAMLIGPDGTMLLATTDAHWPLHPDAQSAVERALESGMPIISDPHAMPGDPTAHIDVLAPLLDDERPELTLIGFLILHLEASDSLYPLLQSWPVPSETAETLLVKRDGDDALFLNDVRHIPNAALSLRVPLTATEVPAVMAIGGIEGIVEGLDYRGEPVLAYLSRIPDSNWLLVVKTDLSEAYREWRTRSKLTLALTIGLAVLMLAVSGVAWQQIRVSRRDAALEAARAKRVADQALAESEERLRLALEASEQGLYDLNVQTGTATVNEQYALMLGYDPATFVETNAAWLERLHPDDTERVGSVYREYTEGVLPEYRVEFRQRTLDGRWLWILSLGRIVERDEAGKPLRMLGTHMDITERKQAEDEIRRLNVHLEQMVNERTEELQSALEELQATTEELQCSNEELVDANAAKTLFLRSMSHELRTPLNSVIGFSKLILQGDAGPITDEQERQLEMINHSGRHLLALINDILDLSRIDAGRIDIHVERFSVADVLRAVASTIEPSATAKGLNLAVEPGDNELSIVSDLLRVKQILLNLAGNAVKFTDSGEITLRGWRAAPGTIALSVRDTGPGVPESDHELIFGEFTQRRREWESDQQGTGLGLAISRRLALLLGGTVTLESVPGQGSTFTLLLPEDPSMDEEDHTTAEAMQ